MVENKKLCGVCDSVLPELEGIQYCPYCGVLLVQQQQEALEEQLGDLAVKQDMSEEEKLAKKPLKDAQIAAREKYKALLMNAGVKFSPPEDIYTLVLKGCENKEILVECLDQVLTRGEKAIRLAVNNMPAILLYKAGMDSIDAVTAVLKDVDALFAVVEGDFDYGSLYKSPDFVRLSEGGRDVLKSIPKSMWLGENIKLIAEDMYLEDDPGIGVLTDNGFFFFSPDTESSQVLLPIYQLDNIDLWEQGDSYFAELVNRDGRAYRMEFSKLKDYEKLQSLFRD